MRSYTNKKGEKVEVTKEHLDTAVEIKKQLQNASPSGRCSWQQLVKMMKEEGFDDAENSENYRCMIKDYQKSIGELPQVEKYADMIADKKLDSIKNLIGEYAYAKREAQNQFRQLNKIKRDIIDYTLIAEQIRESMALHDWSKIKFKYKPIAKTKKKMIVGLSDLHIGALVDIGINTYNYDIAVKRMQEYLNKVINVIKKENISDVYVILLGDAIENPYMHNLAYNCEFTYSEQITKASDLIIKFLVGLKEYANVIYAGIGGNHDRINADKNKNLNGDHAVRGINEAVKSFVENSKVKRITYEKAVGDYEHSISLNGLNVKCVHGDLENINDNSILAKYASMDGINYNLVIMGHFHNFWTKEVGVDKHIYGFGSLKGADSHGKNTKMISSVSQGIVLVDEYGDYEVRKIKINT